MQGSYTKLRLTDSAKNTPVCEPLLLFPTRDEAAEKTDAGRVAPISACVSSCANFCSVEYIFIKVILIAMYL